MKHNKIIIFKMPNTRNRYARAFHMSQIELVLQYWGQITHFVSRVVFILLVDILDTCVGKIKHLIILSVLSIVIILSWRVGVGIFPTNRPPVGCIKHSHICGKRTFRCHGEQINKWASVGGITFTWWNLVITVIKT